MVSLAASSVSPGCPWQVLQRVRQRAAGAHGAERGSAGHGPGGGAAHAVLRPVPRRQLRAQPRQPQGQLRCRHRAGGRPEPALLQQLCCSRPARLPGNGGFTTFLRGMVLVIDYIIGLSFVFKVLVIEGVFKC